MNKQIFVDESISHGLLVFSGVIFDPGDVNPFSMEWRRLLPKGQGELGKKQRDSRLAGELYRLSIKYVYGVYDSVIPLNEYEDERNRWLNETIPSYNTILRDNPFWEELNPEGLTQLCHQRYIAYPAFCSFFEQIQLKFGLTEPVDVTFDELGDPEFQQKVREGFELHRETVAPDQRLVMGEPPKFVDSKDCPPIQLADLWAWWRRKAVIESGKLDVSQNPIPWSESGDIPRMHGTYWDRTDIKASFRQMLGRLYDRRSRIIRPF